MSNQDTQQEKQQQAAQTQQDKAAKIKRNLELMKEAREQEGNSGDYFNMSEEGRRKNGTGIHRRF